MIPGQNLLLTAARIIGLQDFIYYAAAARTTNAIGYAVTTYAAGVTVRGSVQAVPRSVYHELGLDLQKNYIVIYTTQNVIDLARDVSGDQVAWNTARYQCISETDWKVQDGWTGILCVQLGAS